MALSRILEEEVMATEHDALEYDAMDFTDVNLAFALRALELAPPAGTVLDLGTGTARIPILFLERAAPGLRVHGTDLSEAMLAVGRRNAERAGCPERLVLTRADAKELPFPSGSFVMVVSNSLVHHIPEPEALFREVHRVLRPGGALFLRDLCRPETLEDLHDIVRRYAGDADAYQRKLYADSLHAALTVDEVQELVERAGLAGATVRRTSDRHWSVELPGRP